MNIRSIPARHFTAARPFGIDAIIIHHTAGVMTALRARDIVNERRVSYHYVIGSDGIIGRLVDEGNRAWHAGDGIGVRPSGSRGNDRSIGIGVSNSGTAPAWPISDRSFNLLVDLCTDIARRRRLGNLVVGKNLLMHSDVRATACPGPQLRGRMAELARRVNANLAGAQTPPSRPTPVPPSPPRPPAQTPFRLATILRRGRGPAAAVRQLQTRLNQLGMRDSSNAVLAVDGIFGPRTEQAVLRFQRANVPAASRTGQVGPVTARALGWIWAG